MRASFGLLLAVLPALFAGASCDAQGSADVPVSECPAITAEGRLPASPDDAAAQKQKGARFTNRDVRARYLCWVSRIGALNEGWKAEGLSVEQRAKRAYQVRHEARITARAMMTSETDVKMLEERDRAKYGHPDGPTFEWLVERARKKGLTGDAVYEEIVSSAQRTDEVTNKAFGL